MAGAIMTILVPFQLSSIEQGFYYTFNSLIAAQVFFELGLGQVLVQLSARTRVNVGGSFEPVYSPNKYLVTSSKKWFGCISLAFVLCVLPLGMWFLSVEGELVVNKWIGPWALIVILHAVNIFFGANLSLHEGAGHVSQIALLRLKTSVIGYFFAWVLLLSGAALWSAAAVPMFNVIGAVLWLRARPKADVEPVGQTRQFSYKRDVFFLHSKVATSWLAGYFVINFMVPVVFATQGAKEAGKLGIALSIFGAITAVGFSWVSAKLPTFTHLITEGRRSELNTLFRRQIFSAAIFVSLAVLAVICVIASALFKQTFLMERVPTLLTMSALGGAAVVNVVTFSMAGYMRAHLKEPLVYVSLLNGALVSVSAYYTSKISLECMSLSYFAIQATVVLPLVITVFARFYPMPIEHGLPEDRF